MKFKTSDGYILERTVRRTYRMLWTDGDLIFRDYLGWPVDDAGEKLDGGDAAGSRQSPHRKRSGDPR